MMRLYKILILLAVLFASGASQAGDYYDADVPSLILHATLKYQSHFKIQSRKAGPEMDEMLVHQYMSSGRIATEPNTTLKILYWQAATLILNGYPISGGTLFSIARLDPAFPRSAAGAGLGNFVDAMLVPDDDDDPELTSYMQHTQAAQRVLQKLRPALRLVAQLRVIGEIYHDPIAVDAGKAGLRVRKVTPAELRQIDLALKA